MKWTAEMAEAAEILQLDPEDERHRALIQGCVEGARRKRGRPKGTTIWDDGTLANIATNIRSHRKQSAAAAAPPSPSVSRGLDDRPGAGAPPETGARIRWPF
jgi:hypothetical protein